MAERSGDLREQSGGTPPSKAPEHRMLSSSLAGLQSRPAKKSLPRPWMPWLLRAYRLSIVIGLVWLVHWQARWFATRAGASISIRQARRFFPAAAKVQLRDPARGLYFVTDNRGDTVGCLLTTSPATDQIIGYSGPNNLLIALDSHGAIAGLELLHSGDTPEHVARVKRDAGFLRSFIGWKPNETPPPKISAVSGATLTSFAIAESIEQRLAGTVPSLRFPAPITLEEVRTVFTNAASVEPDRARLRVLDPAGRVLGFATRTSPQSDNISGYRGPTDCLVALAPDGKTITAIQIRKSYDTDSYVDVVRRDPRYLKRFVGRTIDEIAGLDDKNQKIEGVSGATLTSRGIAEGLKARFARESGRELVQRRHWEPGGRDYGLAAVIAGSLFMAFSSWRGRPLVRGAWLALLIVYVGLVNHDLLSLALFAGWAAHGVAFKAASGLALLAGAAFLVPWSTRRQLYCHQICPHGAAQQLLGKIGRRRWTFPRSWNGPLEFIPVMLLALALLGLLVGWKIDLASIEPFDAWVWGSAGVATLAIALLGLAASIFIPQGYCRYGCPTGALLNFVRSTGSADRWGRREWTGLSFLGAALLAVALVRAWPHPELVLEPLGLHGRMMGTTWSVKIHDEVADLPALEKRIAQEFEWAESMTSHWRTNTDISRFNAARTTNAMPVPWPVITLARWSAEISRETGGAFDITVGPLVNLWGFGPGPRRAAPPSEAEITEALPAVGWDKLEILDGMLRKGHPGLGIDLSAIAVGWAVDQVSQLLEYRGYTNFLVEAGGELRARGRWTIAIEHPNRLCTLTNESIGTSGTYRRNFKSGGREYSHLINPRTGRPVTHQTVTVSVRGADCAHADAWGAALNVLGVEEGLPLAERLNLAAQFVVQERDGTLTVSQSRAWKEREARGAARPAVQR